MPRLFCEIRKEEGPDDGERAKIRTLPKEKDFFVMVHSHRPMQSLHVVLVSQCELATEHYLL